MGNGSDGKLIVRKLRKTFLPITLAMLALAATVRAQTNVVMSPVASYQFYDTVGETNSPVISPVAAYQFYDALTNVVSSVSSYQFFDVLNDMGTNSIIMTPVSGYYYGPDGVHAMMRMANGLPQLTLSAPAGYVYGVEFSTNLVDWAPLTTLPIGFPDIVTQFSDGASTNSPWGFYRVALP